MRFVDTNVIIDIISDNAGWADWSILRLMEGRRGGPAIIDAVVLAEMSRNYPTVEAMMRTVAALDLDVAPIGEDVAFVAGRRFIEYRRGRVTDPTARVLPDFFIGAHASSLGIPLLTRDTAIYRRYFPNLSLIAPETHPHG